MASKSVTWETVKIFVREYAWVQEGEEALIVYDDKTPPDILAMVVRACEEQKVRNVSLLKVPPAVQKKGAVEGAWVDAKYRPIPKAVYEAVRAADVTISFSATVKGLHHNYFMHTLGFYHGKKIMHGDRLLQHMGSDAAPPQFPRELLFQIFSRMRDKLTGALEAGKACRVTQPWGTDLVYTASPGNVAPVDMVPEFPPPKGYTCFDGHDFVRVVTGTNPPDMADGVVVSRFCKDIGGMLEHPVKFTFEKGWCTKIEGKKEAKTIEGILAGDKYNRRLQEIHVGLNPRVSSFTKEGKLTYEGTSGTGNMHMAVGREESDFAGGEWMPSSSQHITIAYLPKINWWFGDEQVIKNGRLCVLDEPAMIKLASKYGDPKKLLKQKDWPAKMIP
jgi:hypothetical protein